MERKREAELLEGIRPRTWVALSADESRVVGTGASYGDAVDRASEQGETDPILLMTPDVLSSDGASFRTGPAKALFKRQRMTGQRFAGLEDVSADGKRFIFSVPEQEPADESVKLPPLKVLLHWQGGLEANNGNR